jgi:hypothetical protein
LAYLYPTHIDEETDLRFNPNRPFGVQHARFDDVTFLLLFIPLTSLFGSY